MSKCPEAPGRRPARCLFILPRVSSPLFAAGAALWIVVAYNGPLFQRLAHVSGGWSSVVVLSLAVAIVLWAAIHAVLSLFMWPYLGKAVVGLLILAGGAAALITGRYGVLIDPTVIQSVMETHPAEVWELINPSTLYFVLGLIVVPFLACMLWPVAWARPNREFWYRVAAIVISAASAGLFILHFYHEIAATSRNHREMRLLVAPFNVFRAVGNYLTRQTAQPPALEQIGLDALLRPEVNTHSKPVLLIVVVGETARVDHFALAGYPRETNPRLLQERDLWFIKARSCGTSTAVSLPCMFSNLGQQDFDAQTSARESVLHVLARAGYEVTWLSNNSGCKRVCEGLPTAYLSGGKDPDLCRAGECFDEILLEALHKRIQSLNGNGVIVLHQKGNHGPAYYRRYPARFEVFRPTCRQDDFSRCDRASIVNAYDNAIRYTDYVLAGAIDILRQSQSRFHTALLYVSDHGESLGENNLYLHGMPYAFAPAAQTRVPMLLWLPPEFSATHGIRGACLGKGRREQPSHDDVFHTVLGLAGVTTATYRAERDLLARCPDAGAGRRRSLPNTAERPITRLEYAGGVLS